jgi:hypothetical protein
MSKAEFDACLMVDEISLGAAPVGPQIWGRSNADLNMEKSSLFEKKEDCFKDFSGEVAVKKPDPPSKDDPEHATYFSFEDFSDEVKMKKPDPPVDIDPEHATFSKVCCK